MRTHFEVRQQVKLCTKSWLEVVYKSESEQMALAYYRSYTTENPSDYFEFVEVEHNEKTVFFTKNVDGTQINFNKYGKL